MLLSDPLELQADLAQYKADLAHLTAKAKRLSFLLDEEPTTPCPRRRHFKNITQVKWPNKKGDIYSVLLAICEEGRAWRTGPDTDEWVEVLHLPSI
jgi:hypothetical protein